MSPSKPSSPPHRGSPPPRSTRSISNWCERTSTAFTFSLPLFWAILLAAPDLRRNLRTLALGSAIMAVVELLLLMLLIEINARNNVGRVTQAQGAGEKWLLHVGEYLVVGVVPFAAPFILAISIHRDLRRQMLGWVADPDAAAAATPPSKRKSRPSAK